MRIGELAEAAVLTVTALRYYERRGWSRRPRAPAPAHRLHDEQSLQRLRFIRSAQQVGLSLGEIRSIHDLRRPGSHVVRLLHQRMLELDDRIRDLLPLRYPAAAAGRTCVSRVPVRRLL